MRMEKGIEPLDLASEENRQVTIQEDQDGVLVFNDYILNTTRRGL